MADLTIIQAKKELEISKPSFDEMNLNKLSFAREMEFAVQSFEKNPYLLKTVGIANVLKNVVLSGLSLNPVLKYAYLVPRKIGNVLTCCVDPSYVGLIKILTDTGSVVAISAIIVYDKEVGTYIDKDGRVQQKFQIQQGVGGWVKHTPYIGFDSPGKAIACYSVAILADGLQHVELLRPFEWEGIKARSESVKSYNAKKAKGEYAAIPTWLTDESEMIRKTCLKKHYKYLPKTERGVMAANAIDLDNQINGIDFESEGQEQATVNQPAAAVKAEYALATEEDFDSFIVLIENPLLKEKIFGGKREKGPFKESITQKYNDGTWAKEESEKVISFLKNEIKWYEDNQPKPEETTVQEQPAANQPAQEQTGDKPQF